MKKVITALIIILLIAAILIMINIYDLSRKNLCLVFDNSTSENKIGKVLCDGGEIRVNGFNDKRFVGEKGSEFRWMVSDDQNVKSLIGLYSIKAESSSQGDKPDELNIHETVMPDIEKPVFPDVKTDLTAIILKIEGNSELVDEKVEEIFLHFQTDFRQPDVFYIYGTKIPEKIKLLKDTEIIYIYNKPEIIVTDLTLIRSKNSNLYLKNNGTKRIRAK